MKNLVVTTKDGAALSVTIRGDGPPLMLVTGLGGTAAFWTAPAQQLAQAHTVITFDHRGIGASTRGSLPVTVELLADDCAAILDAVGIRKTVLLGHSLGGAIGQKIALHSPHALAGLVLSGTWMAPNRFMTALFNARRKLLAADPSGYAALTMILGYPPSWLHQHWDSSGIAISAAQLSATALAIADERIGALLAFDGSGHAGSYSGPTLVQGAQDDLIVPAFLQDQLAASIPHARQLSFAAGGHFFPISRTDDFVRTVQDWIRTDVANTA
ncbi:MAG: alpha/beta hydrolase [Hyphomicrobiales bacterium]|jgi:aminoacrylate hydrolase|nr:alpha/beta hydrolase [Hyphomicrobiales bacterium]